MKFGWATDDIQTGRITQYTPYPKEPGGVKVEERGPVQLLNVSSREITAVWLIVTQLCVRGAVSTVDDV